MPRAGKLRDLLQAKRTPCTIHADPLLMHSRMARRDRDDDHALFPDPAAIELRALLTTAYEQRRARLGQSSIQPIGEPIHD